ncbi:MAG TPA: phosphoribosylamine--glycine ligase, partial [Candidatus Poseidoniaceae archaeon]
DNSVVTDFCRLNSIDLVVVGPEAPLCDGLADVLEKHDIPCFGPIAALARLEGSKLFAKQIMRKVGIPTADFQILDAGSDIDTALNDYSSDPWVIKRDVLAGGKGVVVTSDFDEARVFIAESIASDGKVLLEEFLPGEEASMLVVMDGSDFVCLPPSQDHKRAYDGDNGPNTGGMGAYCPAPVVTESVHRKVVARIVKPMFEYLSSLSIPYRGVLYVGLMITDSGDPNVVEFNVRFGDPECQITLPLIETDLFEVLSKTSRDQLSQIDVQFHQAHALTIVLASEGYPSKPIKDRTITGLELTVPNVEMDSSWVNFAGVKLDSDGVLSSGGRVLSCSAMADNLNSAAKLAYDLISTIHLEGSFYRTDIGGKAL